MNRGEVLFTIAWVLGYVIACGFFTYITKDSGYTRAEIIDKLKLLGAVYILAYIWSLVLFSDVFNKYFEKTSWVGPKGQRGVIQWRCFRVFFW